MMVFAPRSASVKLAVPALFFLIRPVASSTGPWPAAALKEAGRKVRAYPRRYKTPKQGSIVGEKREAAGHQPASVGRNCSPNRYF